MYRIWNETDHVYATNERLESHMKARRFIRLFHRRYAAQGFYRTTGGQRIDPRNIILAIKNVERAKTIS